MGRQPGLWPGQDRGFSVGGLLHSHSQSRGFLEILSFAPDSISGTELRLPAYFRIETKMNNVHPSCLQMTGSDVEERREDRHATENAWR